MSLASLGAPAGLAAGGVMGQISDAFSAPRRMLWSALGLPDTGAELIARGLGGPGDEYLNHPLVKALGMGAEMVLDPLNLLMMPMGGWLGKAGMELAAAGKAGSATKAAEAVNAIRAADYTLPTVAKTAETAALADPVMESAARMLPLRREFTVLKDVHPQIGERLPSRESLWKNPIETIASDTEQNALPGYLQTGYLGGGKPGVNMLGRPVGNTMGATSLEPGVAAPGLRRAAELREELRDSVALINDAAGYYRDPSRSALAFRKNPVLQSSLMRGADEALPVAGDVVRHETGHGMLRAAMRAGSTEGLPLIQKPAYYLRRSGSGTARGAGILSDEMAARVMEESGGNLHNAWDFLKRPHEAYASLVEQESPLMAQIYREAMIPRLPYAAGAAAATIPIGAGLLYALGDYK